MKKLFNYFRRNDDKYKNIFSKNEILKLIKKKKKNIANRIKIIDDFINFRSSSS